MRSANAGALCRPAPAGSDALDVLCLRNELTAVPSFEFALRERVSRLATFRHPYFGHVRTVERLSDPARTLALSSNATPGVRRSELVATAAKHDLILDSDAALCLIRQLVTAMAVFHEQAPDAAHGALGPERIVVTPAARLVIVEHVMGAAVEQLQFSEDRYWRELRIPCPRSVGLPVFDQRADVLQLGITALTLLLRRPLNGDEFPTPIGDAVVSTRAMSADGRLEALPSGLRPWLTSALQLDARAAFRSAIEASHELEKVFEHNDGLGDPAALTEFLARYHGISEPAAQASQTGESSVAPPVYRPEPAAAHHEAAFAIPEPITVFMPEPEPMPAPSPSASIAQKPAASRTLDALTAFSETGFVPEPLSHPAADMPAPRYHAPEPSFVNRFEEPSSPVLSEHHAKEPTAMPSSARRRGGSRAAVAAILLVSVVGGGHSLPAGISVAPRLRPAPSRSRPIRRVRKSSSTATRRACRRID